MKLLTSQTSANLCSGTVIAFMVFFMCEGVKENNVWVILASFVCIAANLFIVFNFHTHNK